MKINEPVHGSSINNLLAAPTPCSHLLQVYEDDEQLLDRVEQFVYLGLERREVCLVIATPTHRAELRKRLATRRIDVEKEPWKELFLDLDARETLDGFMIDGQLDREKFEATARDLIASMSESGRPIRAFGEMVALLWCEGNQQTAITLEQSWNDLIRGNDISLLCGYPVGVYNDDPFDLINDVYVAHSALVL